MESFECEDCGCDMVEDFVTAMYPNRWDRIAEGVGFLGWDGDLVNEVRDPDLIDAIAARLHQWAGEIRSRRVTAHEFTEIVAPQFGGDANE